MSVFHPMTGRERFLAAANRKQADRVPRIIPLEDAVRKTLSEHFRGQDLAEMLKLDAAGVGWKPSRLENDYSRYYTRPGVTWDEWGRGRIWDDQKHYAEYLYPLERAESVDELLAYPWPDLLEPYRYAGLAERVAGWHARGFAVIGDVSETTFEIAWQLRSMERLFDDMLHEDEKAAVILDQITDRTAYAAGMMARAGVDLLYTGDDVAMQTGLMMSRKLWQRWLGPRLRRVIQAARSVNPDLPVKYHSDGKINDLIPDLIEAGVTILNPVQPECVDYRWVKSTYGDRVGLLWGVGGSIGAAFWQPGGSPRACPRSDRNPGRGRRAGDRPIPRDRARHADRKYSGDAGSHRRVRGKEPNPPPLTPARCTAETVPKGRGFESHKGPQTTTR